MAETPATPNLDAFELAVSRRDTEAAFTEGLRILKSIDDRYGRVDAIEFVPPVGERPIERLATRVAAALGQLLADPTTKLSPLRYEQLTMHHRWIELLFAASGFGSSDHLLPLMATPTGAGRRKVSLDDLKRFLVVFSPAAGMNLDPEETMNADAATAIGAFLGLLGSRFVFTDAAHAFRERLLEWLPARMGDVKLGAIALQTIASPYMHCSYATTPRKHDIKAGMIAQLRYGCLDAGCPEYDPAHPPKPKPKPTIIITTENFPDGHSVHRTHSRAAKSLIGAFHTVGFVFEQQVSPAVRDCFSETLLYPMDPTFLGAVRQIAEQIRARDPVMVLHLGVGMSAFAIALASLRLAPVQAASFGHTATTKSPFIDYFILPDDFVGDPAAFSETLVRLPAEAMPYEPRRDTDYSAVRAAAAAEKAARPPDSPARIAIPASAMKLGPPFFDALARVTAAAKRPVELRFFPLGCAGLGFLELQRRLATRLPNAVVNEEQPYDEYMRRLAACDFFVCPFPYGNMNSIIDAVLVGLPGVCLDGAEAHAHADVAYFRRLGFPKALATSSLDEYVAAIVRLVDDPKWYDRCLKAARAADLERAFFTGDATIFAQAIRDLTAGVAAKPAEAAYDA